MNFDLSALIQNPSFVDIEINNFTGEIYQITDVIFEEASSPCSHIKVKVITNKPTVELVSPVNQSINDLTEFYFEYLRSTTIQIFSKDVDEQTAIKKIATPPELGNVLVNIANSPIGAVATVGTDNFQIIDVEYSLDQTTWQTSNTFDLQPGIYTAYVRDNYGCIKSKEFIVDSFGIQTPHFEVPESNSIRYAKIEEIDNCNTFLTSKNTLSFNEPVKLPYKKFKQLYQTCDIEPTQFKSNYNMNKASVIDCNGNDLEDLHLFQRSNNLRLKDLRDARKFNLGSGKTGVYFVTGNIYDYDTNIDTGNDYSLFGGLPEWGRINNWIRLEGSWFKIEGIIYSEEKNSKVLVIDTPYVGPERIIRVASIFNRENYEVFEFFVDMSLYEDRNIHIILEAKNDSFPNESHLSEAINVKEVQENTVCIRYKNDTNTDVFYSTGISFTLRTLYERIEAKPSQDSETHITDNSAVLTNSLSQQQDTFVLSPMPTEMMRKHIIALGHRIIDINGIGYVKNDNIETDGPLDDTNLYEVKANMIKSGKSFNAIGFKTDTLGLPEIPVDLPQIISGDVDIIGY